MTRHPKSYSELENENSDEQHPNFGCEGKGDGPTERAARGTLDHNHYPKDFFPRFIRETAERFLAVVLSPIPSSFTFGRYHGSTVY